MGVQVNRAECAPRALQLSREVVLGFGGARASTDLVVEGELKVDREVVSKGKDLAEVTHLSEDAG